MATITSKTTSKNKRNRIRVQSGTALPADTIELSGLPATFPHCFLSAQFFDAVGDPVIPSAGTLTLTVQADGNEPNFETVPSNVITAATPTTLTWAVNTIGIRVIPTALAGVTTWIVTANFNRT